MSKIHVLANELNVIMYMEVDAATLGATPSET